MSTENQPVSGSSIPTTTATAVAISNMPGDPAVVQGTIPTSMPMPSIPMTLPHPPSSAPTPVPTSTNNALNNATIHASLPPPPPPPPPLSATPVPSVIPPQTSGPHQNMIQSALTQSSLPQVQVIQQPLPTSAYLQQLYPQQQMLLPGNLTIQPAGMGPTLQSLGTAPGLSLQLQSKGTVDPKGAVGPALIPASPMQTVNAQGKGVTFSTANMISAPGQMIAAGPKPCVPGYTSAAKSGVLQSQQGFAPASTASQTVVIGQLGQLGVFPSQPSIIPAQNKTVMTQPATLQPKSPILPCPVSSAPGTAQVLSSTHLKHLTSTPQLITSQAPAMIASQAQILGSLQALGASFPQGITWAPSALQSPALLAQNPILIRSQQSDMFIQSPPPTAALHAVPMAAAAPPCPAPVSTPQMQKPKQVRVRPASSVATQTTVSTSVTVNSHVPPTRTQAKHRARGHTNRSSPGVGGNIPQTAPPQMATTQTQTHPPQHQKADAANQTKPTPEMKSTATQSRSTATETRQQPSPAKPDTSQPHPPTPEKTVTTTATTTDTPAVSPTSTSQEEEKMDTCENTPVQNGTEEPLEEKKTATPPAEEAKTQTPLPLPDQSVKEKQHPQKAIVKPHVLTHVIDGYIIQEGPEPFPVSRSSLLTDSNPPKAPLPEKPLAKSIIQLPKGKKKVQKVRGPVELAKCEFCGKLGPKSKFKRSKRFCSTSCAKRYNVGCSRRLGLFTPAGPQEEVAVATDKVVMKKKIKSRKGWRKAQGGRLAYNVPEWQTQEPAPDEVIQDGAIESEESAKAEREIEQEEETTDTPSGPESSMSPTTPSSHKEEMEVDVPEPVVAVVPNRNPLKWTVQEVVEFVRTLPGCADYADEFHAQEIDGQALMLLKEDHLMSAMSMKLGPALKICARINTLKDEINRS